ncbi:hypothetical protein IB274_02560 [Pseudomonas sp. PDM18]|uniref:hypothetical protein n=1 Tax=Pseudomonas sp. PDM18 TaxID=2769253 RepID=UPI001783C705|nr:hypothetical protein [Pseudomonas sp. PDM18]MBD9675561.1 hypothetical protein [Pseudomonas sp. PDM18]
MSERSDEAWRRLKDDLLKALEGPPKKEKKKKVAMSSADYLKRLSEINRTFENPGRLPSDSSAPLDKAARRAIKKAEKAAKAAQEKETKSAEAVRAATETLRRRMLSPVLRCPDCKMELPRIEGEVNLPRLCRSCESRAEALASGFRSKTRTEYSEIEVVPGGAPGSGKRK